MNIFLDTNVYIDFLSERQPFYYDASQIVSHAIESNYKVGISTLSLVNAHYICHCRCKMPVDVFKNKLSLLKDVIDVSALMPIDIHEAYSCGWNDFEDCVQDSIARRWGAEYIITRNPQDFSRSYLKIMTPDDFISKIK